MGRKFFRTEPRIIGYEEPKNTEPIPLQTGRCQKYEDHVFTVTGTVTVGGVELKKVRCRKPSCGFETTTPVT